MAFQWWDWKIWNLWRKVQSSFIFENPGLHNSLEVSPDGCWLSSHGEVNIYSSYLLAFGVLLWQIVVVVMCFWGIFSSTVFFLKGLDEQLQSE